MATITQTSIQPVQTLSTASSFVVSVTQASSSVTTLDVLEEDNWFFGFITRSEAEELLSRHNDVGAFLVRESIKVKGDLVLSVKEKNDKINHYIINRMLTEKGGHIRFKIGDIIFADLPALLGFYCKNNLNDTPLDFSAVPRANDSTANRRKFFRDYLAEAHAELRLSKNIISGESSFREQKVPSSIQRKLPSKAIVIQTRIPNAYDKTALLLKEGQIINVTKTDIGGCWEGEVDGRSGHFPFNYVKFIEESSDPLNKK